MLKLNYMTVSSAPSAYVTKNKQRIKQIGNSVYLNNGNSFELELFNPTTNKILSKIELNGKSIGSGIILRPGERVFLERFIDSPKKFLFETYEIDGNNSDALQAIALNGNVKVLFYNEQIIEYSQPWQNTTISTFPTSFPHTFTYTNNIVSASAYTNNIVSASACCFTSNTMKDTIDFNDSLDFMETGRIEKGEFSNQKFSYDYSSFCPSPSWESNWKILPMSQKPIMKEDIIVYCISCGRKRKSRKNERYCPQCGTKY